MPRFTISRRMALRGGASGLMAALFLPPLEAMFDGNGVAYADGSAVPKRFAMWWWAQGIGQDNTGHGRDSWIPQGGTQQPWSQGGKQVGTFNDTWTAPSGLQPFIDAGLRNDISLCTGTRMFSWSEEMHLSQMIGMMTSWPMLNDRTQSHQSLVMELASRWGAPTPAGFAVLGANIAAGGTLDIPSERSPQAMFDRVFGVTTTTGTTVPRFKTQSKKSVLDLVATQAATLSAKLGSADKQRLQAHLTSVRDLESRLDAMPPPMTGVTLTRPGIVRPDPDGPSPDYAGYHDAFADVMAMAVATNRTRVLALMMESGQSGAIWAQAGATDTMHSLTHPPAGDAAADNAAIALHQQITYWKMQRLARFISALKAIPEGAGTVLDNTLLLATTEMDDPFSHYCIQQPMIFAGRAGGSFITGRHYAGYVSDPNVASGGPYTYGAGSSNQQDSMQALLTVLRALGEPDTTYGGNSSQVTDPAGDDYGVVSDTFGALLTAGS